MVEHEYIRRSFKQQFTPQWNIMLKVAGFFKTFLSISNIHGLNHLAAKKRHPVELLIWFLLVCMAIYGSVTLSKFALQRYQENPTVISMERDRFAWNISFPTATICPTFKLNETLVEEYINTSSASNKTALREFIESLAYATYETFGKVVKYDAISSEEYMPLLLDLQFKITPLLTSDSLPVANYTLTQTITEMGICYTFNSQLAVYNSPAYWKSNKWELMKEFETFFGNALDGDIFINMCNLSTGFDIYLHGPYETADITSKGLHSQNGFYFLIYLTGLSSFTSDKARALKVHQRKCRFYDESNLLHSPVYSYVLCRMECRALLAKKLCKCIPHFYRKRAGDRICDVDGLHCLAKHKDKLISLNTGCTCLPNCDEVIFIVEEWITREFFLGSNLQWGMRLYPTMRLKRDVIFGFTDMLVSIGGMAGLFLGCSILSFIEIIYYFTIRLFWFVIKYKKETESKLLRRSTKKGILPMINNSNSNMRT